MTAQPIRLMENSEKNAVKIVVQFASYGLSMRLGAPAELGKSYGYYRQLRDFGEFFFHLLIH